MKGILITGISGFLGWHLVRLATTAAFAKYSFAGIYHRHPVKIPGGKTCQIDINDTNEIMAFCGETAVGAVIHLAALSKPNYCEMHPGASRSVNLEATENLAARCREAGLQFLFASTDLVFGGHSRDYRPGDLPDPICLYGRHKAAAEQAVLRQYPEAVIARLPLMYGMASYADNYMSQWLATLQRGNTIRAFTDEWRSPAYAEDVARGLLLLLDRAVTGIWHMGGRENLSRYEFAVKMAGHFGLDDKLILSAKREEVSMAAPRPADVSLNSALSYRLGYDPRSVDVVLAALASAAYPG